MIALLSMALAAPPNVVLEVLDPGTPPRAPLAVAPATGTIERVDIDMAFTADVTNETVTLPTTTMPPLRITLRSEVVEVSSEAIRAAITVPEVSVGSAGEAASDVQAATEEAVAPMTSLQGLVTLDPFGAAIGAQWSATEGASVDDALVAEVERAVELLQIRRPTEPLGAGARWTVTRDGTDEMGFTVHDVETWTVAERTSDGWVLEFSSLQRADVPQQVGPHTLKSHTGAAQGRVVLDAKHLHPSSVELGLTLRTRVRMEGTVNSTTMSTLQARAKRQP